MILNMGGGGGINAQLVEFTVDSVINDRDLVIEGVKVPGGIVKGYALMFTSSPTQAFISGQIMSLSADLNKAMSGAETLSYYSGTDYKMHKTEILGLSFSYDVATEKLTFTRFSNYVFASGTYSLLIW